jgi:hypothetical protein
VDLVNPIHFLVFLFAKREEQQLAAFEKYRQRQNRNLKIWGLTLLLFLILLLIAGLFVGKKTSQPTTKTTAANSEVFCYAG